MPYGGRRCCSHLDVVAKIGSYRGESRFTTWVWALTINTTATELACFTRRPLPLTMDDEDRERPPDRLSSDPHTSSEPREIMRALHKAVEQELTERQRQVLIAVALNEAPIDELAVRLASSVAVQSARMRTGNDDIGRDPRTLHQQSPRATTREV
jgi:RNA polymerase sigma-70 factor, ECF subfamily